MLLALTPPYTTADSFAGLAHCVCIQLAHAAGSAALGPACSPRNAWKMYFSFGTNSFSACENTLFV